MGVIYVLMLITALILNHGFGWPLKAAAPVSVVGWLLVGWVILWLTGNQGGMPEQNQKPAEDVRHEPFEATEPQNKSEDP